MEARPVILGYGPPDGPWWIEIAIGPRAYKYTGHPDSVRKVVAISRRSAWMGLNFAKKNLLLVGKEEDEDR